MGSILDQLEKSDVITSDVVAQSDCAIEQLDPRKYRFLMDFSFISQIFSIQKIRKFQADIQCIIDAHLSEYEIFLRQMDTEYPRCYSDIPVIEPDNMNMLKASDMEFAPDSKPEENKVQEKWNFRLFVQFNMPPRVSIVFRTFTELSHLCKKYKIDTSKTCAYMRMNMQEVEYVNQNTYLIDEYTKCRQHMIERGIDVNEMDKKFGKMIATSASSFVMTYSFKNNIMLNKTDFKDFEYIYNAKVNAIGFASELCQEMFNVDLKKKIEAYRDRRKEICKQRNTVQS